MKPVKLIRISALIMTLSLTMAAYGQNYQLHSVFIYSFSRYIQWPQSMETGDFVIQVLGDSPIIEELNKMAETKKVGTRTIKVVRVSSAQDLQKCNILFIPAGNSEELPRVLSKINDTSTLIVTESEGMGQKGSAINFVNRDGKLAFEINQSTLNKHQLKASSELMRLAIII